MITERTMDEQVEFVQEFGRATVQGVYTFALVITTQGELINYGTGEVFWDKKDTFGFASPEALFEAATEREFDAVRNQALRDFYNL